MARSWFRCRVEGEAGRGDEVLATTAQLAAADFAEAIDSDGLGCPEVVEVEPSGDESGGRFRIRRRMLYSATAELHETPADAGREE